MVFKESLENFNLSIDANFTSYLSSAAQHHKPEENAELPFSGIKYQLGSRKLGNQYNLLSPFACLSGKANSSVGKNDIQASGRLLTPNLLCSGG
jgi:hypothetical protein